MNKELKKLFWLGVIGLFLAGAFLISSWDIKFKDTSKIPAQEESYNAVKDTNEQYFQNLQNQEQIASGNIEYNDIIVVVPKYLYSDSLAQLKANLELMGLKVNYRFVHNNSSYRDNIKNDSLNADLMLVPYDWMDGVDYDSIDLNENIVPYFVSIVSNLVDDKEIYFVPYSIDPVVGLVQSDKDIPDLQFHNLLGYSLLWKSDKKFSMPFVWFSQSDSLKNSDHTPNGGVIEGRGGDYENYFPLLNYVLDQLNSSENIDDKKTFESLFKNSDEKYYSSSNLQILKDLLKKNKASCELFPAICIFSYNFVDIKIGFLSDLDIIKTYFSGTNVVPSDLQIKLGPIYSEEYPIRVWGFVHNKSSDNSLEIQKFLQEYIANGQSDYDIFSLPVMNQAWLEKDKTIYDDVLRYEDSFDIINWGFDLEGEI